MLIEDEAQGEGTVDHVPVYPREVVKRALELNASALILVHNHPSGDPTPSQADIDMTRQIQAAAKPLGIVLHDHISGGRGAHVSFRNEKGRDVYLPHPAHQEFVKIVIPRVENVLVFDFYAK